MKRGNTPVRVVHQGMGFVFFLDDGLFVGIGFAERVDRTRESRRRGGGGGGGGGGVVAAGGAARGGWS